MEGPTVNSISNMDAASDNYNTFPEREIQTQCLAELKCNPSLTEVTKSPIVSAPSNTPVVATPTASAKPAAVAVASAPRRSCRARRINSRFDLDEVDESFKQLVARIAAPDSHSILQSPELAFHSPAPPPPVTIHSTVPSSAPHSTSDPDEAEELAKFSDSKRAKKQAKGSKVVRKTKGGDISVSRMANGIDKASKNFPTKTPSPTLDAPEQKVDLSIVRDTRTQTGIGAGEDDVKYSAISSPKLEKLNQVVGRRMTGKMTVANEGMVVVTRAPIRPKTNTAAIVLGVDQVQAEVPIKRLKIRDTSRGMIALATRILGEAEITSLLAETAMASEAMMVGTGEKKTVNDVITTGSGTMRRTTRAHPSNSSEAKYSETESKPLPEKSIARASIQTKEEVSSETSSTRDTIDNPVTPPSLPDSKPLMNVMDLLNLCRANIPNSSREPSDSPPGEKADVNTNTFVSDIAVPDSPNNKTSMGALPTDSVPSHLPNVMPVFNSHSTPDFPLKLPLNAMGTNPVGISTTEDFEASKARAQQRLRELGASSDSDVSPDSSMRKRSPPYHENTLNDAAVHVRKLDVDEKLEDVYKLAAREACSLQKDVNFESGKLSNSFDVPGDLVGDVPADKDDSPYIASPEPKVEETPEEREKREEEERRLAVEKEERNKAVVEARLNSYVHLKENLYLIDRKKSKQSKEVRRMVCDCFLTKEELANGEKGCGEDCLNRLLMIECGWRCPLGDACLNRQFQTCAYGPVEVFNAEEKGCGVRATSLIEPGTFIMEYVGEVFDQREFRRRRKDYGKDGTAHFYFMALKADQFIDATRKGNISRFVNHSCDPNAETQKWTVNGDLRIGFFATKFIRPGEEINFDYRMERYGREPQKCYCGTAICRGWLGEPPDEKTKEEKEEEKKKLVSSDKRKKEEKKHFDDELLDDVSELARVGLRNKRDTLLLSRVMVRAETNAVRMQLLSLLCAASANMPCLRLFMDYHGLSLLWSWMADLSTALQHAPLKLKILNALDILPITNRTQVSDSRVMEMVEKWSKQLPPPPPAVAPASAVAVVDGSPTHTVAEKRKNIDDGVEDDDSSQLSSDDNSKQGSDENSKQFLSPEDNSSDSSISTGKNKPTASAGVSVPEESSSNLASEPDDSQLRRIQLEMVELALKLLERWQVLKEEFRIPKKQRVELMKEHEREVEAGYRRYLDTERGKRETKDRYGRSSYDNWRCKVPVLDSHGKAQRWPSNDAISIMMNSEEFAGLSKEERREKFAQKVAQEDEQRRLQEGMWSVHVERCGRIGLDPYHSPIVDPSGQYYWDASNSTWVPLTPETAYAAGIISPAIAQQHGVPVTGSFGIPGVDASMVYDPNSPPVLNGKILPPVVVTVKLPPHWHIARDQFNRVYFYHNRSRQTQWEIPTTETKTTVQISDSESDSTSSSSDSEEEFSSDEDDANDDEAAKAKSAAADADDAEAAVEGKIIRRQRGKKKHSEALVQQRVISPIRELDRELARKERREAKERAKHEARKERQYQELMVPADDEDEDDVYDGASDDVLLSRVAHHASRDKLKTKSKERAATAIADNSERARKIKDLFRSRMATFIVSVLNPYRRADCKKARINTTDDFKYLARKLTHFVMVKELKQLPSIDDLDCSESVKHKTKDFVRKYMAKYGTSFKRDPLDTKEY
ncbi:hypothetical protein HAZT_HAZT000597 [Hyalella azteca]|uniref:[histone H3]-lysine(36) N-trimethyltransferase n=1 Tax=Hyalella azteca TaxID=294128 RepID=A0A6A0H3G6_HYAAZ|nr:hypothetical protein HAZT_HAZT000597 [Hyalella azteca]